MILRVLHLGIGVGSSNLAAGDEDPSLFPSA